MYYLFASPDEIDAIHTQLSDVSGITCVVVKNNASNCNFLPQIYVKIHTEMYSDVGVVDILQTTLSLRYTLLKAPEAHTVLI